LNDYTTSKCTRDGVSRGTNVSVSGGSDKTTYYASFGRSDLGFYFGNNLSSTNGKLSLNTEVKENSIGGNLSYSEVINDR
jgi:hypothetical protein